MDSGGVNALLRARSLLGREERALARRLPRRARPRACSRLVGIADLFALFATRARPRRRSCAAA